MRNMNLTSISKIVRHSDVKDLKRKQHCEIVGLNFDTCQAVCCIGQSDMVEQLIKKGLMCVCNF